MPSLTALSNSLAGLRRAGPVESGQGKLVCPFCGTESPYQIDRVTGKIRSWIWSRRSRAPEDQRAGRRRSERAVPELPRGDGV